MKLLPNDFKDLFVIENFFHTDDRGSFVKIFNNELYEQYGIHFIAKEIYYSVSRKNVIRGMHFQMPPQDHAKLVYVMNGSVVDVVLDIRKKSSTYGKCFSIILEANQKSIYIPSGFTHGFKALANNTTVVYNQTSCYSQDHDSGILWNSFGFNWNVNNPIISNRDKMFIEFNKFNSPF